MRGKGVRGDLKVEGETHGRVRPCTQHNHGETQCWQCVCLCVCAIYICMYACMYRLYCNTIRYPLAALAGCHFEGHQYLHASTAVAFKFLQQTGVGRLNHHNTALPHASPSSPFAPHQRSDQSKLKERKELGIFAVGDRRNGANVTIGSLCFRVINYVLNLEKMRNFSEEEFEFG